jgi:hypothetical protein
MDCFRCSYIASFLPKTFPRYEAAFFINFPGHYDLPLPFYMRLDKRNINFLGNLCKTINYVSYCRLA